MSHAWAPRVRVGGEGAYLYSLRLSKCDATKGFQFLFDKRLESNGMDGAKTGAKTRYSCSRLRFGEGKSRDPMPGVTFRSSSSFEVVAGSFLHTLTRPFRVRPVLPRHFLTAASPPRRSGVSALSGAPYKESRGGALYCIKNSSAFCPHVSLSYVTAFGFWQEVHSETVRRGGCSGVVVGGGEREKATLDP